MVDEIRSNGGTACANYDSVDNGERIIETAINVYGRIDVLINNIGVHEEEPRFSDMTDHDWDAFMKLRINGTYKCTRAAWPYFKAQNYGRIINTSSYAGLYGRANQIRESGLLQLRTQIFL